MQSEDTKKLFLQQIATITNNDAWTTYQKNKALFELFTLILEEATADEKLNFTTLFSRLAYVGAKYQLKGNILHYSHIYRKCHEQGKISAANELYFMELGIYTCFQLLCDLWQLGNKNEVRLSEEVADYFQQDKKKTIGFKPVVEAVVYEIDEAKKQLLFYDEEDPSVGQIALYDVHDKNEQFNQNIESLCKSFELPIHINLIDVDIREDGTYLPLAIIIQPDHLVDVTAIAECFKDYGAEPFLHLISKYKPSEATTPLLIGNLVNFMLDELISNPATTFKALLSKMFHTNPLGFAMLDDQAVQDTIDKLKIHCKNLQLVVNQEFKVFEIDRKHTFLEPSFYSRDYGIQGRLDLLHQREDRGTYDIIELKSGSTFKPNVYGINASHYIQTLLYDLMIKSTFHTKARSFNYILYSKESDKPLRFAPPVKAQQYEAMKLRNDILAIEQKLKSADADSAILSYIKTPNFPKLKGFNIKDIENFNNIYTTLNQLERAYFNNYSSFIAREQSLAKTGEHGINKSNGHAALWLESNDEKIDRFALFHSLTIIDNQSDQEEALITFAKSTDENTLTNFRIGDIGVLYPFIVDSQKAILQNQIFKCSILDITDKTITVKLRNKQYNQSLFKGYQYWNIEQDNLDSGFNVMYKSLFTWAASPLEYRQRLMGLRRPRFEIQNTSISFGKEVSDAQTDILQRIISARDYFLLWGPPGTGKTSIMLKYLVKYLHEETKENILLLAYTNRAVDEICDAVLSIDIEYKDKFLRLGSRLGTDPRFSHNLLDQMVKNTNSRQEILDMLKQKRIYISTVSSVVNRVDLFHLKTFDTVIIDEASQILEPMLLGLLARFNRYILIGDHKQLPAVVIQDKYHSKIKDETLQEIGFQDTRTSLFERLYMQVSSQQWTEALGLLEQQGRMNHALMEFPNMHFYDQKLQLLPGLDRLTQQDYFKNIDVENNPIGSCRTTYINTPEDTDFNWKTNVYEANAAVDAVEQLIKLFAINDTPITNESIGIITPYRAQIANIKDCMKRLPAEIAAKITVDTVERYQGGARDIIIISFCVNRISQLSTLISPSIEGIDRKLNVALTRAREHIILIGNKAILSQNMEYKKLLDSYTEISVF